jgi:hypothetical protein
MRRADLTLNQAFGRLHPEGLGRDDRAIPDGGPDPRNGGLFRVGGTIVSVRPFADLLLDAADVPWGPFVARSVGHT